MTILGRSLKFGSHLCVLKLENCNLADRALTSLGKYLFLNILLVCLQYIYISLKIVVLT